MFGTSKTKIRNVSISALIAALYVALTGLSFMLGLDKGIIQFRLSEILTVIPYFSFTAVPGVFCGCFISGLLFSADILDTVLGSLVTLIAALMSYYIGKKGLPKYLSCLPPIILNALYVPLILKFVYLYDGLYFVFFISALIGEGITAGLFGTFFIYKMPNNIIKLLKGE